MRITTSQIMRNYQSGLSKANNNLNKMRNQTLTQRKFAKVSEDPSSAAQAFKLRKDYLANDNYIENLNLVQSQFDAVESSALQINDIMKEAEPLILQAINGTTSSDQRETIASSLRKMQESLVYTLNSKFGNTFLFGGQNTTEVPFELVAGELQYQGKSVSDPDVQAELEALANESIYVDLGFGLSFDAGGDIINNSAFNSAFSGLSIVGYGVNDEGTSENLVDLLGQLATELEKDPLDDGAVKKLTDQFTESKGDMLNFITELGTNSKFLEDTKNRLEDNKLTLNEKIINVENVDLAEAITNYSWAEFAYNAALKIGSSILSPSLIDFMS